ncbi:hypothetical protein Gotri_014425 [Gossypium trilobum]|uniref:Uncharacterized protein n=1 Tax=Gossypium trilobum TaxID=34281 RepID=A0A7J9DWQ9_9ROSI|nr:hypothetical protein [Gossypium trilobum]
MIYGGQIKMSWLRRNFEGLDEDLTEVKKERHVRTCIFQITRAILMPDKSQNLIHLKWLLKLVNFREADELIVMGAIPVIIFTSSSKLPVYIPSRNKFERTPYEDPAIQECILEKFFVNPNIWNVKIPLVVYIIVEMHESNRVLRQFGPSMFQALTESPLVMLLMYGTQHSYTHPSFVTQTPPGSLFYQGESSFQPPIPRPEDTRWQTKDAQIIINRR